MWDVVETIASGSNGWIGVVLEDTDAEVAVRGGARAAPKIGRSSSLEVLELRHLDDRAPPTACVAGRPHCLRIRAPCLRENGCSRGSFPMVGFASDREDASVLRSRRSSTMIESK